MAKKKKGRIIQMLSPEKYIKQKARTLPIHECWVNEFWDEDKLVTVFVAREHSNKNITLGIYLVDLKCLGIKDTNFKFNISQLEYKEFLDQMIEYIDLEKIDYQLAHNIIFSGYEYADELEFKPHPDFSLTKYILEEDNETIDLIDIECGIENKPFYEQEDPESDAEANKIIAHLEKVVGKGNFDFLLLNELEEEDDDEIDVEEYLKIINEINKSSTFQFKIQIKNIKKPPVWRRVKVPSYMNFLDFHIVIQASFGWLNQHLFSFSPKGYGSSPTIEMKIEDDLYPFESEKIDAENISLLDIFNKEQQKYTYIYDFGDDWTHSIILEKIIDEATLLPELIDGKGKCPFEDCGGSYSYENIKYVLSDPQDPEYETLNEWYCNEESIFNPSEFDLKKHQHILTEVFNPDEDDLE